MTMENSANGVLFFWSVLPASNFFQATLGRCCCVSEKSYCTVSVMLVVAV
jgi:hypothetical protein